MVPADAKRSLLHFVAVARTGVLARVPIPCRLPSGGWFITYGDEVGVSVLSQSLGLGTYELGEYRFVARFVRDGMVCLDIGANQGVYTVLLCRRSGASGSVIAFEPIPFLVKRLRLNLKINGCASFIIVPVALSNSEGLTNFYTATQGKEAYSSMLPPLVNATATVSKIAVTTLDGYLERTKIPKIDFVKIDAEGAELKILEGGKHLFEQVRPTVLCEVADVRTQSFGYPARMIYEFLEERAYKWFQPDTDGLLTSSHKREQYTPDWVNLVAVPEESLSEVATLLRPV
jgi:FkbM family methyltransferase